jgi:hypothetical protein
MDMKSFSETVQEEYNQLLDENGSGKFEVSSELTEDIDVEFSGVRKNNDRWGENKFAVDARVDVSVQDEENWAEVSDQVNEFTELIRQVLEDTLGYTGPVVIRSSDDRTVRSWARRLVKTEQESEE